MKERNDSIRITYQNQSHLALEWFKTIGVQPSLHELCQATDLMVLWACYGECDEMKQKHFNDFYIKLYDKYQIDKFKELMFVPQKPQPPVEKDENGLLPGQYDAKKYETGDKKSVSRNALQRAHASKHK
jgi:hypothetical protein